jgi:hypothetical protein
MLQGQQDRLGHIAVVDPAEQQPEPVALEGLGHEHAQPQRHRR